jgi:phage baseplate assembly protein W
MQKEKSITGSAPFLGTGWSFPPQFVKGAGEVLMTSDEADIEASLKILFGTVEGERFLRPKYGLDLRELLFDPLSTTMATLLKERITTAILVYEPRIHVMDLTVDTSRQPEGILRIFLDYSIRATNSRFNLVFPFSLNEGSSLNASIGL